MVHFQVSTKHAHSVTYSFDYVSLLSAIRRPKTIFPQMLATTEQKPNLEQSTSELSKCLTVLSDARIRWHCCTKRMCVDVSDVLINVAPDGLITSAAEVAWPSLGCSCSASLAARSGKSFSAVVDVVVECKKWENN